MGTICSRDTTTTEEDAATTIMEDEEETNWYQRRKMNNFRDTGLEKHIKACVDQKNKLKKVPDPDLVRKQKLLRTKTKVIRTTNGTIHSTQTPRWGNIFGQSLVPMQPQ